VEANGYDDFAALLFRFAQGTKSRGQRRICLHTGNFAVCRLRCGFGIYTEMVAGDLAKDAKLSSTNDELCADDPSRGTTLALSFTRLRPVLR